MRPHSPACKVPSPWGESDSVPLPTSMSQCLKCAGYCGWSTTSLPLLETHLPGEWGFYLVCAQTAPQLTSPRGGNEPLALFLSIMSFLHSQNAPTNRHTGWKQGISSQFMSSPHLRAPGVWNILKNLRHFSSHPQNFSLPVFPKRILTVYLVMSMSVSITNAIKTFSLGKLVVVRVCHSRQSYEEVHLNEASLSVENIEYLFLIHCWALKCTLTYSSVMPYKEFADSTASWITQFMRTIRKYIHVETETECPKEKMSTFQERHPTV